MHEYAYSAVKLVAATNILDILRIVVQITFSEQKPS